MKKISFLTFARIFLAGIFLTGSALAKTPNYGTTGASAKTSSSKKSSLKKPKFSKMTTALLLKKMADALGGLSHIEKIHSLYFEIYKVKIKIRHAGQPLFMSMGNTEVKDWMTMDGNDRMKVRSAAYGAPPTLMVISNGQESVKIPVTVTSSSQYRLPAPGGNCSKPSNSSSNPLCVNVFSLNFNLGYYKFHSNLSPAARFSASETGFTGTIFESNTCGKTAVISPASIRGGQGFFTVTPKRPGKCAITVSTDSPEGWFLEGDQGMIGTSNGSSSTGQMSGIDLEREISGLYWTTFAYLNPGGLPGKVSYKPLTGGLDYVLQMNPDGGVPMTDYINKKTFLPDKLLLGNNTDPSRELMKFKSWKTVNGLKFPSVMLVNPFFANSSNMNSFKMKYLYKKIKVNVKTTKNMFKQPTPAI